MAGKALIKKLQRVHERFGGSLFYPVEDWKTAVAVDGTLIGYWEWVAEKLIKEYGKNVIEAAIEVKLKERGNQWTGNQRLQETSSTK